jgi:hypothetical protein
MTYQCQKCKRKPKQTSKDGLYEENKEEVEMKVEARKIIVGVRGRNKLCTILP